MSDLANDGQAMVNRRVALRTILTAGLGVAALQSSGNGLNENETADLFNPLVGLRGHSQSPINLEHSSCFRSRNSQAIELSYDRPILAIERSEHGLKLLPAPGNLILLNGQKFELEQIHFHTPSEHTIDGRPAAGEIHFVHKNNREELAVVGVLLQEGGRNPCFDAIFNALPEKAGQTALCKERCNPSSLLPPSRNAFVYEGSLTTSPYTEGVRWVVMESPLMIEGSIRSEDTQLACLSRILGDNHREVQPKHGRGVALTGVSK